MPHRVSQYYSQSDHLDFWILCSKFSNGFASYLIITMIKAKLNSKSYKTQSGNTLTLVLSALNISCLFQAPGFLKRLQELSSLKGFFFFFNLFFIAISPIQLFSTVQHGGFCYHCFLCLETWVLGIFMAMSSLVDLSSSVTLWIFLIFPNTSCFSAH